MEIAHHVQVATSVELASTEDEGVEAPVDLKQTNREVGANRHSPSIMIRKIHMYSPSTKRPTHPQRHCHLEWKHKCLLVRSSREAMCSIRLLSNVWKHWLPCQPKRIPKAGPSCPLLHARRHTHPSRFEGQLTSSLTTRKTPEQEHKKYPCKSSLHQRCKTWSKLAHTRFNVQGHSLTTSRTGQCL